MTKSELEEVLQTYKEQIDFLKDQLATLREERSELQKQNFNLQEGIINIRAPEAYRDMQADRSEVPFLSEEEVVRQKKIFNIQRDYVKRVEDPLFKDPDEMIRSLSSALNSEGVSNSSLHGNDES